MSQRRWENPPPELNLFVSVNMEIQAQAQVRRTGALRNVLIVHLINEQRAGSHNTALVHGVSKSHQEIMSHKSTIPVRNLN